MIDGGPALLDWATAGSVIPGETVSGDQHAVLFFPRGALVALIDGLGHGIEAARAAKIAAQTLNDNPWESLPSLMKGCHESLRKTRGVVMSLASFNVAANSMTWAGVGNVEAVLLRSKSSKVQSRESLTLRGGVVGFNLPNLLTRSVSIFPGDTLVMATDGIKSHFTEGLNVNRTPGEIAEAILARFHRGTDDALVVVARYRGAATVSPRPIETLSVREESDVMMARKRVSDLAAAEGMSASRREQLALAVSELARNILVHATRGEIRVSTVEEALGKAMILIVQDEGPGIADLDKSMEDGHSTNGTLGLGLPSARRMVDDFKLETKVGQGTRITLKKWILPPGATRKESG